MKLNYVANREMQVLQLSEERLKHLKGRKNLGLLSVSCVRRTFDLRCFKLSK